MNILCRMQVTHLGAAWAGNSVNCVPFRHAPILSQGNAHLVSYFDQNGAVAIAEVDPSGLRRTHTIPSRLPPHDAHQAISMGQDSTGAVHVAWGAHNSRMLISRRHGNDPTGGFDEPTTMQAPLGITYPMFLSLGDEFLLMFRRGPHFRGEIMIRRYDAALNAWHDDAGPLISGALGNPPCGPYVNTPVIATNGDVALFIVWRLPPGATNGGAVVNAGIDCMLSTDRLRSLQTRGGIHVTGALTPVCSERVIPVPLARSLINQASAAAMPDGRPAVLTFWDHGDGVPQYRLGWPARAGWRVAQASQFATRFSLDGSGTLPLPHSRPELLFDLDGRALVIYRSAECGNRLMLTLLEPPDYAVHAAQNIVLVDEDLGQYEPIIGRAAWQHDQSLVAYVQHCQQGTNRDGKIDIAQAPARLFRWQFRQEKRPKWWQRLHRRGAHAMMHGMEKTVSTS